MCLATLTDPPPGLRPVSSSPGADPPDPLLAILKELVQRLDHLREGRSNGVTTRVSPRRWVGGGFVYLEVALPGIGNQEIDINIHAGRAFVRMAGQGVRARSGRGGNHRMEAGRKPR
jgi:hypothetical protein